MSDDGHAFSGSMPEFYQRYIVPMLFKPHARILAARWVNLTDGRVLEIAAGTGAMTRTLGHADPGGWSEPPTTRPPPGAIVMPKSGVTCISPPAVRLTIG
jgi:hypothetical protein